MGAQWIIWGPAAAYRHPTTMPPSTSTSAPPDDNNMDETQATTVCDFWFGPLEKWDRSPEASVTRQNFWWHGGEELDQLVQAKFGDLLQRVAANPDPVVTPQQTKRQLAVQVLARVIVLSQFSRHILPRGPYDNPGTSEEYDVPARNLVNWAIAEGLHMELRHYEKSFLYMPFIQSEALSDQDRAMELFAEQQDIAIADGHRSPGSRSPGYYWMKARREVVAKFGRLPFRNEQLGRTSTPEEIAYLRRWSRACA